MSVIQKPTVPQPPHRLSPSPDNYIYFQIHHERQAMARRRTHASPVRWRILEAGPVHAAARPTCARASEAMVEHMVEGPRFGRNAIRRTEQKCIQKMQKLHGVLVYHQSSSSSQATSIKYHSTRPSPPSKQTEQTPSPPLIHFRPPLASNPPSWVVEAAVADYSRFG